MSDPIRIQLRRIKGWRLPPNTVVVSRPSKWGNPFMAANASGCNCNTCLVARFQMALSVSGIEMIRRELRGKNLACWCPLTRVCHADPLLEIANDDEVYRYALSQRGVEWAA